jgi:hypothetical protein
MAQSWGELVWSQYGTYLRHLATLSEEGRVLALGYDWRLHLEQLGLEIAQDLREYLDRTGAEKLRVVAHSMGGLVLRAALRLEDGLASRIERILYLCPPTVGAVVLYRRLFTGMQPFWDWGLPFAAQLIQGSNRLGFVSILSGLPGPFQLLPSDYYPSAGGRYWHPDLGAGLGSADLYGPGSSPPGILDAQMPLDAGVAEEIQERLQDVEEAHQLLGDPAQVPGQAIAWLIYGTGLPTDTEVTLYRGKIVPAQTLDGDGVVPAVSARALQLPTERMHDVPLLQHGLACRDPRVHALTATIL